MTARQQPRPPQKPQGLSRREVLQVLGAAGAGWALSCQPRSEIERVVQGTPLVDTHEHLPDEIDRLQGDIFPCDDWTLLLHDYIASDLVAAGMPTVERKALFSREVDPVEKWKILEPFWPTVMNTGYGRAVRLSMRALYGVDSLDASVIPGLQKAYEELCQHGLYDRVLVGASNIESCQVNSPGLPFHQSSQPTLLMQDLSFQNLHIDPDIEELSGVAGIDVRSLEDWHRVIRWWFDEYSTYAVAAKSQGAYSRGLNYRQVGPEEAEPIFSRVLNGERVPSGDQKTLEDHLFWFCVGQATHHDLPVKIHTGHLEGNKTSHFRRIAQHPQDIAELCQKAPETRFVFLHIAYPYWEELIAVAKRAFNAYVDMSWAWITDPAAAEEFLKHYLVTAPTNKLFTFGGDYSVVECVVGHAVMARRGIVRALEELVNGGLLLQHDAVELVEPLARGNARRVFRLEEKTSILSQAPWV